MRNISTESLEKTVEKLDEERKRHNIAIEEWPQLPHGNWKWKLSNPAKELEAELNALIWRFLRFRKSASNNFSYFCSRGRCKRRHRCDRSFAEGFAILLQRRPQWDCQTRPNGGPLVSPCPCEEQREPKRIYKAGDKTNFPAYTQSCLELSALEQGQSLNAGLHVYLLPLPRSIRNDKDETIIAS